MIDTGDVTLINEVIGGYTQENSKLIDQLMQIQYYWRGALSRDDVWAMSPVEREHATEFLNKRFKEIGDMMKKGIHVSY